MISSESAESRTDAVHERRRNTYGVADVLAAASAAERILAVHPEPEESA